MVFRAGLRYISPLALRLIHIQGLSGRRLSISSAPICFHRPVFAWKAELGLLGASTDSGLGLLSSLGTWLPKLETREMLLSNSASK